MTDDFEKKRPDEIDPEQVDDPVVEPEGGDVDEPDDDKDEETTP